MTAQNDILLSGLILALAAVVGFAVMLATMGIIADMRDIETKAIMGMQSIDTGVFGGIVIGAVAASVFNRYYRIELPAYLGFFAVSGNGSRFGQYGLDVSMSAVPESRS